VDGTDEILRTKDVENLTGIPENTLRWYRATRQGPPSFKLGARRVVYRKSAVLRWIAEQEQAGTLGGDAA
jgi:predicted DNA-binding transcriptional regulator AlpA